MGKEMKKTPRQLQKERHKREGSAFDPMNSLYSSFGVGYSYEDRKNLFYKKLKSVSRRKTVSEVDRKDTEQEIDTRY